jgi:hypothetical protein
VYGYNYSYDYDYSNLLGNFESNYFYWFLHNFAIGYWLGLSLISIFLIVCYWKLYEKANEPGWAAIVPFYNSYVLFKMAFGNGWMFLLLLVPIVNIVFAIMLPFKLAKAFGESSGFGVGLWLLPVVFYPILAFGKSKYVGVEKK